MINEAQVLHVELNNVSVWFKSSKLSLDVNKSKESLFHTFSKRKFLPQTLPNLFIEKIQIKRENVTNFWAYISTRICPENIALIKLGGKFQKQAFSRNQEMYKANNV